jgi:hypothetical protein
MAAMIDHRQDGEHQRAGIDRSIVLNNSKQILIDEKVREKTGQGLDHWFAVLDQFGGVAKGHSALATHIYADHGVPGWYAQGITVAYERARGVRTLNQRVSGDYEVSVSKVVSGDTKAVARAFTDARRRRVAGAADRRCPALLAPRRASAKGFVVRPDGLGRFRYGGAPPRCRCIWCRRLTAGPRWSSPT